MISIVAFKIISGLTWDAGLKFTGVKLDLIHDSEMHLFLEDTIRGGISTITKRTATANNPFLPDSYDSSKPTSFIQYWDVNNLYGESVSEYIFEVSL